MEGTNYQKESTLMGQPEDMDNYGTMIQGQLKEDVTINVEQAPFKNSDNETRGSISSLRWLALVVVCSTLLIVAAICGSNMGYNKEEIIKNTLNPFVPVEEEFDYIVVGGGPSGIIAAIKLAKKLEEENNDRPGRVLLLESGTASQSSVLATLLKKKVNEVQVGDSGDILWSHGSSDINKFDIPLMWSAVANSQGRRSRRGASGKNKWSLNQWPIGPLLLSRMLGGSGMYNAMIYVRSLPTDFKHWPGEWTWENVLPHYKDLENLDESFSPAPFGKEKSEGNSREKYWRGYSGAVRTTPAGPEIDVIAPNFVQSAIAAGLPLAERGFNHPDPDRRIGASYYEFNIEHGIRDSIAHAMLGKNTPPANLVIRTDATVMRVLTKKYGAEQKPRAVGVEYFISTEKKQLYTAEFRLQKETQAEVILAAGAIMTPQLLANSGIGEGGSVKELPGVGKNLQDHPVVAIAFGIEPIMAEHAPSIYTIADEMENYVLAIAMLNEGNENVSESELKDTASYLGTLGTAGFSAGAFLRSPWADGASPDLQLTVFPRVVEPHVIDRIKQNERNSGKPQATIPIESRAMLVTVALIQPEARYEVRPSRPNREATDTSTGFHPDVGNPFSKFNYSLPSVDLPANVSTYLSDLDVKRLAWGVEEVRRIRSFPPLLDRVDEELSPGPDVVGDALDNHIKLRHLANAHWVGSTKMGTAEDPLAVVDDRLRVFGVENLRIVDAGVLPRVPNGNTHSTVCVVASRGADLIMEDRRNQIQRISK